MSLLCIVISGVVSASTQLQITILAALVIFSEYFCWAISAIQYALTDEFIVANTSCVMFPL